MRHPRQPPEDPSRILRKFPRFLRPLLRRSKIKALDVKDRLGYLSRCLRGLDVLYSRDAFYRTRVLGQGDGRWAVSPSHLSEKPTVYSFGIGLDISFDLQMIKSYDAEVYGFDPTPIAKEWLSKQSVPSAFHHVDVGLAAYDGNLQLSLPIGNAVSFTPFLCSTASKDLGSFSVKRFSTLRKQLGHEFVDVVKIDIEGSEFAIIDDLVQSADFIQQLLIEFHHRMLPDKQSYSETALAVEKLRGAGFRLFAVSPRGLEFSFLRL